MQAWTRRSGTKLSVLPLAALKALSRGVSGSRKGRGSGCWGRVRAKGTTTASTRRNNVFAKASMARWRTKNPLSAAPSSNVQLENIVCCSMHMVLHPPWLGAPATRGIRVFFPGSDRRTKGDVTVEHVRTTCVLAPGVSTLWYLYFSVSNSSFPIVMHLWPMELVDACVCTPLVTIHGFSYGAWLLSDWFPWRWDGSDLGEVEGYGLEFGESEATGWVCKLFL